MERISRIQPQKEKFTYPKDFEPDEKLKHAFGMFYDDPLDVEIWFSAGQARYVQERIWAVDQQISEQKDGSIIQTMKTSGRYEIKKWVLGYGADAELLQPADLRDEIREAVEQLGRRYC